MPLRNGSICKGESGLVRPFTADEYMYECDPEFMTTFFCSWYGVEEPVLKENSAPDPPTWYDGTVMFAGRYYETKNTLSYNRKFTGLIIHELAHHINYKKYNGHGHDQEYSRVLQEMIDNWR